ncbi:hypothetical protein Pst134EA_015166 [Puccinia striiformis f. sp. tritici]|uniref:hypothetical protein n=1 Tax=Puccinia striiformis f. sp. tritici TaxID=168172 RepID=UPI002008575A|nr:hypothetical protein Pst134EA_015166 [Puccinia striiformis f. sp. tritici]KAH9456139.1 hypothetical protein Pst134EB_012342 [Puccinia striiformis f. sp. tritici]KAH9463080.1 hypothetical protein Pst134EA_015166 [Puccinia striiformis f. sp. tritici]
MSDHLMDIERLASRLSFRCRHKIWKETGLYHQAPGYLRGLWSTCASPEKTLPPLSNSSRLILAAFCARSENGFTTRPVFFSTASTGTSITYRFEQTRNIQCQQITCCSRKTPSKLPPHHR